MPDGKTLVNFNGTARCQQGSPLYGNWFGQSDIYGDGIAGGHGGSALSSIGGSIRKGELLNDEPIHHALKIDLWGKWLYYNSSSPTPGRRWPAALADFNASNQYKGSNPALVMGSLLAIPPNVTAESLGLTTKVGKSFKALQNYGAYVVDDADWDDNYICVEQSAEQKRGSNWTSFRPRYWTPIRLWQDHCCCEGGRQQRSEYYWWRWYTTSASSTADRKLEDSSAS
jgi:hypothetical protein